MKTGEIVGRASLFVAIGLGISMIFQTDINSFLNGDYLHREVLIPLGILGLYFKK